MKLFENVCVYLVLKEVYITLLMNKNTRKLMRYMVTILALFFLNTVMGKISGGQDSGNYTDANGLRQRRWVITGAVKSTPGYKETDKIEEGEYKDNLKQGIWIQYYPGGLLKNKITFKDNRPDGYTVTYFMNGKVNEEGIWRNNRWVGDYKLNYENGNPQHQFHYNDNGKRDGVQDYFNSDGKKIIEGNWTGGKQSGATTEWNDDGTVKAKEIFNNGALDPTQSTIFPPKTTTTTVVTPPPTDAPKATTTVVKVDEKPNLPEKSFNGEGYWKLYNKNKQIAKDGTFHSGHLIDGKSYIYDNDGILQKIAVYKSGVYQGDAPITEEDKK
ncbi:MAG TPA: hypothetical protein VNZ45_13355 [Bacteroidia bacterium]|jgi:antitoxin component YwqK of YwqJK toxin-antitoxin module|nr:hypothetical protein [Bacteroidia bacterium]